MAIWNRKSTHKEVRDGVAAIYPRLWRYCLVLTGERVGADDLAQATSLRALERSDQFKRGTHLDRWLFRIAQRIWISELRSQAIRKGRGLASIEETELTDPKLGPEINTHMRQVMLSVLQLPEAQRSAVMLVYVEGYSYREAAMVLDIPVGTVMSRLSVARGKMAQIFRDESEVV